MDRFAFTVIEPDGGTGTGVIEAADRAAAAEALTAAGRFPVALERAVTGDVQAGGRRRLADRHLAVQTRGLGLLLRAGAPLDRALAIQAGQASGPAAAAMAEIGAAVKAGAPLSAAMQGYAPPLIIGLIEAGESGGQLASALIRTADLLDDRLRLRAQLRGSLIYPAVVLGLSVLAVVFLAFAVLPQFEALFRGFRQDLPWATSAFLEAGRLVREFWWLALAFLVTGGLVLRLALATETGRAAFDRTILRVPVIGAALRGLDTARFARTLALLLEAGAPMLQALTLAIRTVTNRFVSEGLQQAAASVREGARLSAALSESEALSPATVAMVRVGEESGSLSEILNHVATLNQSEAERKMARLVETLTPVLTLLLGGLVATLMASIISAVFSINAVAV